MAVVVRDTRVDEHASRAELVDGRAEGAVETARRRGLVVIVRARRTLVAGITGDRHETSRRTQQTHPVVCQLRSLRLVLVRQTFGCGNAQPIACRRRYAGSVAAAQRALSPRSTPMAIAVESSCAGASMRSDTGAVASRLRSATVDASGAWVVDLAGGAVVNGIPASRACRATRGRCTIMIIRGVLARRARAS